MNDAGNLSASLQICEQVISINPHLIAVHLLKLHILESQGQEEALEKERQVITSELRNLVVEESKKSIDVRK